MNNIGKRFRIRKYLRNKYKMSDNELNEYLRIKHHLDYYPSRDELFKLEPYYLTFDDYAKL